MDFNQFSTFKIKKKMKLKEFMVPYKDVCFITPDSNLDKIASVFVERRIGSVLVKEDLATEPVGIITKTDVVEAYLSGLKGTEVTARWFMSKDLKFCNENETRETIAHEMMKFGHHHMLIQNDKRELVGMVSVYDISLDLALDARRSWLQKLFKVGRKEKTPKEEKKEKPKEEKKEEKKGEEKLAKKNLPISSVSTEEISTKIKERILAQKGECGTVCGPSCEKTCEHKIEDQSKENLLDVKPEEKESLEKTEVKPCEKTEKCEGTTPCEKTEKCEEKVETKPEMTEGIKRPEELKEKLKSEGSMEPKIGEKKEVVL